MRRARNPRRETWVRWFIDVEIEVIETRRGFVVVQGG